MAAHRGCGRGAVWVSQSCSKWRCTRIYNRFARCQWTRGVQRKNNIIFFLNTHLQRDLMKNGDMDFKTCPLGYMFYIYAWAMIIWYIHGIYDAHKWTQSHFVHIAKLLFYFSYTHPSSATPAQQTQSSRSRRQDRAVFHYRISIPIHLYIYYV